MLHGVAVHDDDIATAGTDIASADFIDGEDKVILREVGGGTYAPVLRAVHYGVYDAFAAAGTVGARWKIQPNPWPETQTIGQGVDWFSGSKTADAGVCGFSGGKQVLTVSQYNRQLTNNLDWVNAGNSVIYSSVANTDAMLIIHMSYGPVSVSKGGPLLHIVKTFAAVTNADVWDQAFSEVLSDDSPGTDPDRRYRVHAMRVFGATTIATDYAMAARLTPKGSTVNLCCLGGGNAEDAPWTLYDVDSIEFNGNQTITAETVGSATNDGGQIEIILEDIGPAITGGSQGGSGGRVEPGSTSFAGPSLNLNTAGNNPLAGLLGGLFGGR